MEYDDIAEDEEDITEEEKKESELKGRGCAWCSSVVDSSSTSRFRH